MLAVAGSSAETVIGQRNGYGSHITRIQVHYSTPQDPRRTSRRSRESGAAPVADQGPAVAARNSAGEILKLIGSRIGHRPKSDPSITPGEREIAPLRMACDRLGCAARIGHLRQADEMLVMAIDERCHRRPARRRYGRRPRRDLFPRSQLVAPGRHQAARRFIQRTSGESRSPRRRRTFGQRVPASVAGASTTSKSCVIVAVLAIIADAEQYFSTDSAMARSTFSGATPRPFTTKCM